MIAAILIPLCVATGSMLPIVGWKVSLNRAPWNHGSKTIRPRISPRSLHSPRSTARPATSVYIVANIVAFNECRAIAGVRTSASNDDPKEVTTLRAFETPHLVPSGNRRDPHDDPFDIACNAVELGIHGARFLWLYFGANCLTRGLI